MLTPEKSRKPPQLGGDSGVADGGGCLALDVACGVAGDQPALAIVGCASGQTANTFANLSIVPPTVEQKWCVGDCIVPVSGATAECPGTFHAAGRGADWVCTALGGRTRLQRAKHVPWSAMPTAEKLRAALRDARGKHQRMMWNVDTRGDPLPPFIHVVIDDVSLAVSSKQPTRLLATEESITWFVGSVHADLKSAAADMQSLARDDAAHELFTDAELQTLSDHSAKLYCNGRRRFIRAAPKTSLPQGARKGGYCILGKEVKSFYISAGSRKGWREGGVDRKAVLRQAALRAMAEALAYHDGKSPPPRPDPVPAHQRVHPGAMELSPRKRSRSRSSSASLGAGSDASVASGS